MRQLGLSFVLAALLAGTVHAEPEPLALQVNRAIDRGVAKIREWQVEDGSFNTHYQKSYPVGNTALHLYTLVKSGVPADDPQVVAALSYLRYKPFRTTYGTAVLIMALDALKDPAHRPTIFAAARWLEDHFHMSPGLWAYPTRSHDLSNTQYGVLGLWVAERNGFESKVEIRARLLEALVSGYQKESGGFSYWKSRTETGAMTTAGITILELAIRSLPADEIRYKPLLRRAREALDRAWAYLDRRFVVHANPLGPFAFTRDAHHYYLFGVERVAAITGRTEIGGRDWYVEGARHLVETQEAKGTWVDSARATCFALLFLRRATATTMDYKTDPVAGDGVGAKAPAIRGPAAEASYIRRWLLLGPIPNPDDGGLYVEHVPEKTVAPRHGDSGAGLRWQAHRSLSVVMDLDRILGAGEKQLVYAFTYLHAKRDTDAILWIGHDDDCRVFLDGTVRYEHHYHESRGRDSVKIPLKLTAGTHRLLLKIGNWQGDYGFSVRMGGASDGKLAPGLLPSLDADGDDLEETALAQPEFFSWPELLVSLPLDRRPSLALRKPAEASRLSFYRPYPGTPEWFGEAADEAPRYGPSPGFQGAVRVHPWGKAWPASILRRVKLPEAASRLRVRVSADGYIKHRGRVADGRLRLGVFHDNLHWIADQVVGPHNEPSPDNWTYVYGDLAPFAGKEVLLIVQIANGGRTSWWAEGLYIDEIGVLLK